MADNLRRILLIDGAHYDRIRNALDTNLDFQRLLLELSSNGPLTKTIFHRDLRNSDERKRRGRFLEWLVEIGVTVKGSIARGVTVVLISTLTGPVPVVPPQQLIDACNLFVDLADRLDILAR